MGKELYAERDIDDLGDHYAKHVSAMTTERLHSKSAIAAELAFRDCLIEQQAKEIKKLRLSIERSHSALLRMDENLWMADEAFVILDKAVKGNE